MKVYRSQYWYKDKTWFSDFPKPLDENNNYPEDRLKFDTKIFALNTGLKLSHAKNIMCGKLFERRSCSPQSKEHFIKYFWKIKDMGLVDSNEFNQYVVMS